MHGNEYKLFSDLCRSNDPLSELILLVSIRVNESDQDFMEINSSETALPRKHAKTHAYVLKYMKMKLYFGPNEYDIRPKSVTVTSANLEALARPIPDDLPLTLILTSLESCSENEDESRQLFMANLLSEFQMRGINIREAYPKIYRDLCLYVEENRPSAPRCLFPRDLTMNNLFVCLIMPDSEPTNYAWLYENEQHAIDNSLADMANREGNADLANNMSKNASFNLSQYLWIR